MDNNTMIDKLNLLREKVRLGKTVKATTLDGYPFKMGQTYYYIGTSGSQKLFYRFQPSEKRGYSAYGQGDDATIFDPIMPVSWKVNQILVDRSNYPETLRTAGE